jgi:hypothetical protein
MAVEISNNPLAMFYRFCFPQLHIARYREWVKPFNVWQMLAWEVLGSDLYDEVNTLKQI